LRDASVTVHHGPHYTMPERSPVPCAVTVHDLTFFDHPEWHERSKVLVFRRAIRIAARRAEALVCVSALTAERLHERLQPSGRVFVVPHGVDHARFRPDGDATVDGAIRRRLGVREPYVVFVGTIEPRKAVPVLLAAFDRLAGQRADLSLVLVGRPGWRTSALDRMLGGIRARDRVVRLGYVPDDAVPALLRGAVAAAYPALEEGFGLPALEAMACGTPLVTTSGTAMAELAQDAAALVAPGDVSELADALGETIDGGEAVQERRRRGLVVATRHTWSASAAGHVVAYRWAASCRATTPRGVRGP
jgi:glycosyltransferase involved in cell wall biosynthesis